MAGVEAGEEAEAGKACSEGKGLIQQGLSRRAVMTWHFPLNSSLFQLVDQE